MFLCYEAFVGNRGKLIKDGLIHTGQLLFHRVEESTAFAKSFIIELSTSNTISVFQIHAVMIPARNMDALVIHTEMLPKSLAGLSFLFGHKLFFISVLKQVL